MQLGRDQQHRKCGEETENADRHAWRPEPGPPAREQQQQEGGNPEPRDVGDRRHPYQVRAQVDEAMNQAMMSGEHCRFEQPGPQSKPEGLTQNRSHGVRSKICTGGLTIGR
jgi:hypothetical protein